ncbi:LysM peptidoglycan-binding domain-containing protein [Velocimicrobium porci]|uniref:LysM peptidoglycan-binding domain-containing protein n=1 Tax=Velocimicrobium porci TaxID=2606634 RepID=A0A6L5XX35_9FIRM|nr:LysM peptidoglycan-binding domain-containing protein [Velocimicrobium porci]MSS63184.1 LysM peptidoglycan-binding domain-containing protein [Velocimicrobium porci]
MQIWLKKNGKGFRFPVLPQSIEVTSPQHNETITTTAGGEKNLIGKKGLRTLTLQSFFPAQNYSFCQYKVTKKPWEYIKKLESWKGSVLTITITGTNIHFPCTIESLVYGENDSSKDVNFTIELKEYKQIKEKAKKKEKKSKTTKKVTTNEGKRPSKEVKTKTYVVKKGDCLWNIAKRETGKSDNWRAIYNQNKQVIGSNPNKLKIGQKLVIKI